MLENILIDYFELDEDDWYKEDWDKSYSKLISLIYKLDELGVLSADKICDSLDIINNMEE